MNAPSTASALDLLNSRVPVKSGYQRDAALHHFSEVTAATALNDQIFGTGNLERWGSNGMQRQVMQALEQCVGAVGELRARVGSLEAARDGAEARADAAERRAARAKDDAEAKARAELTGLA